jgi:uncharacterized Ntn-hydrolase superfamily protein
MTYSIVARDPATGQIGVAVQSRYFSTGSVVTWAEAGVGAVATQAMAKVDYGPEGVALMRDGASATAALAQLVAADQGSAVRQVAMIDAAGHVAAHTGAMCIEAAGHIIGKNYSVQANMMVDDSIWPAMRDAYEAASGDLADRMLAALDAAQAAGGDIRGQQSAAMLVVSGERNAEKPWRGRLLELRVEDHARPLDELRRLARLHRAYRLSSEGDALVALEKHDEAGELYIEARALAPENDELQFWSALALLRAGREDDAMALFKQAFAQNPPMADLLPRLVPLGLVADDPGLIARIVALR